MRGAVTYEYLLAGFVLIALAFYVGPQLTGMFSYSTWWDTSFEHRIPLRVEETGIGSRLEPIEIDVTFESGAFPGSLRLIGQEEIPYQLIDSVSNGTHLTQARLAFMAQVPASGVNTYYLYYSTQPREAVDYGSLPVTELVSGIFKIDAGQASLVVSELAGTSGIQDLLLAGESFVTGSYFESSEMVSEEITHSAYYYPTWESSSENIADGYVATFDVPAGDDIVLDYTPAEDGTYVTVGEQTFSDGDQISMFEGPTNFTFTGRVYTSASGQGPHLKATWTSVEASPDYHSSQSEAAPAEIESGPVFVSVEQTYSLPSGPLTVPMRVYPDFVKVGLEIGRVTFETAVDGTKSIDGADFGDFTLTSTGLDVDLAGEKAYVAGPSEFYLAKLEDKAKLLHPVLVSVQKEETFEPTFVLDSDRLTYMQGSTAEITGSFMPDSSVDLEIVFEPHIGFGYGQAQTVFQKTIRTDENGEFSLETKVNAGGRFTAYAEASFAGVTYERAREFYVVGSYDGISLPLVELGGAGLSAIPGAGGSGSYNVSLVSFGQGGYTGGSANYNVSVTFSDVPGGLGVGSSYNVYVGPYLASLADQHPPVISGVTLTPSDPSADPTPSISFTVTEQNANYSTGLDTDRISVSIGGTTYNSSSPAGNLLSCTGTGATRTCSVTTLMIGDGDHSVDFTAYDQAGNTNTTTVTAYTIATAYNLTTLSYGQTGGIGGVTGGSEDYNMTFFASSVPGGVGVSTGNYNMYIGPMYGKQGDADAPNITSTSFDPSDPSYSQRPAITFSIQEENENVSSGIDPTRVSITIDSVTYNSSSPAGNLVTCTGTGFSKTCSVTTQEVTPGEHTVTFVAKDYASNKNTTLVLNYTVIEETFNVSLSPISAASVSGRGGDADSNYNVTFYGGSVPSGTGMATGFYTVYLGPIATDIGDRESPRFHNVTFNPADPSTDTTPTVSFNISDQGENASAGIDMGSLVVELSNTSYTTVSPVGNTLTCTGNDFEQACSFTTLELPAADYDVNFTVKDNAGNPNTTVVQDYTITTATTEFELNEGNVTYSPATVDANDAVDINATIFNLGTTAGNGLNISLEINGGFTQSWIEDIAASGNTTIGYSWTAVGGNHTFNFTIDTNSSYTESDETNNNGNETISVFWIAAANVSTPIELQEWVKGKDASNEDVKAVVNNIHTMVANVYAFYNQTLDIQANCSFYWSDAYEGYNETQDDGTCSYTKDTADVAAGAHTITVNFTAFDGMVKNHSTLHTYTRNLTVAKYETLAYATDTQLVGGENKYMEGDIAVLNITTLKDNVLYNPEQFVVEMRKSDNSVIERSIFGGTQPGRVRRSAKGRFWDESLIPSGVDNVHWHVWVDNATINVSSAVQADIAVIGTSTATINISIYDETQSDVAGGAISFYQYGTYDTYYVNGSTSSSTGESVNTLTLGKEYRLETEVNQMRFRLDNLNITAANLRLTPQMIASYGGTKPLAEKQFSSVIAFNSTNVTFGNATLFFPANDMQITDLCKCEDWTESTGICAGTWACNKTSDYDAFGQNTTDFWFTVMDFSAFGGSGFTANLTIWDQADSTLPFALGASYNNSDSVFFYANYTNYTSQAWLNDTGTCQIKYNDPWGWTVLANMTVNNSKEVHELTHSFPAAGTYNWNVTCNQTGYDLVELQDTITIGGSNGTFTYNNSEVEMNATLTAAGTSLMTGINMPKDSNVTTASLNITGVQDYIAVTEPAVYINGSSPNDRTGWAVSSGDYDGDGYGDLAIAGYVAPDASNYGQAYVFLGGSDGLNEGNVSVDANLTINGTSKGTLNAFATADYNNDGYDDLTVASYDTDSVGSNSGQGYVFLGGPNGLVSGNVSDANSTINGTSGSWAFRPLSAGDLNNDNYGDLVVGAGAGGTNLGGQAAVLFGGPNGIEEISISDANVTFNGSSYLDYLGYGWINLAVGDMNNDGVDDFVGGSYGAGPNGAQSGQAYVFFGPFTQGQSFNATLDANLTFNGSSAGDWFGEAFAIGDFDNNGNNDLGIGAKNADENGANAGQAYIFLGPFVQGQSFNATIAANATINGSAGSDNLGLPLVADDFNNDTYDDFVVVAKSADGDSSNVGQAYLFLGGPNGIHSGNATQHANLTLSGLESGYGLSFSGTSGNFNNDSYPELALGCDSADIVDSNAGQTLVYDFAPYLKDITIDIGNDADNEWTGSGRFSTVQNVSDFISEVNDYLDTCTAVNNNCTVPISISAGSAGQVSFDQLEVVYDYLDRSTLPKTLTGWKRIWIPDPNFPNNFTVEIVLQAINGSVSNIFFSDYLPSGATVYTDNVTYWNSTGKGTYNLTNSSDYFKTWEGLVSLPDGTIADVYIYNFTGSSTLWEGQLFANDTLNVTYNVSVLGGGSWKLPTLIFGLDPATGEMISVPLGDEVAIPLFDVFVDVQNKVVEVGDVVVGMVKMLNVGGPLVQVDMSLTSYISDPEGNVMDKSNEMVAVYRKQEKTVLMQVPEDAQAGKYLFHTVGVYSGQMVATSSDIFEVKRAINDFANIKENSNLILMFGMLMIILMLARSKTVIVKEVIREESVKDAKSKKPK